MTIVDHSTINRFRNNNIC